MSTKVLHIIPSLNIGGAEACLTRLVTSRSDSVQDTVVATLLPFTESQFQEQLSACGVRVVNLSMRRGLDFPRVVFSASKLIKEFRPNVVQGWLYYGDLVAALGLWLSGRRSHTRLYWGVRCSDVDLKLYSYQLTVAVRACVRLSGYPDAVIANSEAGLRVHKQLGYRPRSFSVIRNGIDTNKFKPSMVPDRPFLSTKGLSSSTKGIVGIAGRVDPQKDYETFLRVVDKLPEVSFIAVGAGTEELPARSNLYRLGVCKNMPEFLSELDVVLSTSAFGEGFPNVLAEGMACGTPVVTTDVGDASDIVGDTGAVCPIGDAERVAQEISRFLDEPPSARLHRGASARSRIVQHFGLDHMVSEFERIYEIKRHQPT